MKTKPDITSFSKNNLVKDPSTFIENSNTNKEEITKRESEKTTNQTTAKMFRISLDIANTLKLHAAQESIKTGTRVTEVNIVENALQQYFKKNNLT